MEIELKLTIAPDDIRRLARVPAIKTATSGATERANVYSVYYDSPDFLLRRHGAALRLRRVGKSWVQTLKGGGRVEAGLHQRQEIEHAVPAQMLDYGALSDSGIDRLIGTSLAGKLAPVFVTDFIRTTRQLKLHGETHVELCVDRGEISAGTLRAPISEIELELKQGAPEQLVSLALALLQYVPLRLEAASKAQRGYALAEQSPPAPVKSRVPGLEADMDVYAAFRCIIFSCIEHLQRNEHGVLEGRDPEYLHQARVALRRLRSAFSIFRAVVPAELFKEELTQLLVLSSVLGYARDWDVFIDETLPGFSAALPGESANLARLTESAAAARSAARADAIAAVNSKAYTALLLCLTAVFLRAPWNAQARNQPVTEFAKRWLQAQYRKTLKRMDAVDLADEVALHRLRIQVKKLRYGAEFMSRLYSARQIRAFTKRLARLQELLGTLNDGATAFTLARSLYPAEDEPATLHLLRGWGAARAQTVRARLPKAMSRLDAQEVFW